MTFLISMSSSVVVVSLYISIVCVSFVRGFQQELWLYQKDGNALHFQAHVPDTAIYYPVLQRVTKYCAKGKWFAFRDVNFNNVSTTTLGLSFTPNIFCGKVDDEILNAKSFRFWGANDTSVPGISLYSEESYAGQEILVTGRAHAGISVEIKSIGATGTTNWRLFEGPHLDGNSTCYKVPATAGYFFNFDYVKHLQGINGIKSVFRGCDLKQVEVYKKRGF